MSEQWYAVYEKATGRLHATGTVVAGIHDDGVLPDHLAVVECDGQPDEARMWDEKTLNLVPRPIRELRLPQALEAIAAKLTDEERSLLLQHVGG